MDNQRALATVDTIADVRPIPDADAIECVRVRGWDVVVKKGEFSVGDPCVYIEVDAHLDVADPRFAFLASRGVRTNVQGFTGHVLKTAKLRGQYSQGIVFPLSAFPELAGVTPSSDVTGILGIEKWDPPIPAELAGVAIGPLPGWFRKTDEERIQNVPTLLAIRDIEWVATEKIDGTSMSVWVDGPVEGVGSRNLSLVENQANTMWAMARQLGLHEKLRETFGAGRAVVQGELYGPGIQGNPLGVDDVALAVFSLWDGGKEVPRAQWPQWAIDLSVPTHTLPFPATIDEALTQADALKSALNPQRNAEGIVWRAAEHTLSLVDQFPTRASFKAISNRYLLKNDRA